MSLIRQFVGTSSNSWIRVLVLFILTWAFLVYVFVSKLNATTTITNSNHQAADINDKRFRQALELLENSKQHNDELKKMINELLKGQMDMFAAQNYIDKLENNLQDNSAQLHRKLEDEQADINEDDLSDCPSMEPSIEYELLRRRIQTNIGEMWNYFSNELGKLKKKLPNVEEDVKSILLLGAEHKRSLINDMENIKNVDGFDKWRQKESMELSNLVQRRLKYLQNPKDCGNAKKLICKLNKGCGYGCQLHHVVYCFIVAYATERTMILRSKGWRYHQGGWEEVFRPISDTCLSLEGLNGVNWPGNSDSKVVILPIIDSLVGRPAYLPLAIPEDLAPRLKRLHGDPIVWWIGQFLKYLLRPQSHTKKFLQSGVEKMGWKKPIVGVHVRRTDKVGTEAAYHTIAEYMTHVEDYYLTLEINGTIKIPRRVFIASDDARVIEQAHKEYPQYEIIGDQEVARMAAVSTRYSVTSLNGIILDIHMLAMSDYLVCTFSSQVCRVAYEIMQTLYPDAANRFKSLDDIYYYGGQNAHNREVVIPHKKRSSAEITVQVHDLIGVAGNHWDGFSKGSNKRTDQVGLFPSFKVVDKVETAKLPVYPNA